MKKFTAYFYLFISFLAVSCSGIDRESDTIRIKGSDTMLHLARMLAAEYMTEYPGVLIIVEGGGTAAGVGSLVENEIDILTASRNLKPEEVKLLAQKYNQIGLSHLVAKDALTIFIHPENSIRDFSIEDLKMIFTGKIKDWKELGGEDLEIRTIIRSPNSGTYLYFKEHVLNNEVYSSASEVKATTEGVINEVEMDNSAIGYGGIGYGTEEISAKINGIFPSEENVKNDSYPVIRYLYFYTISSPKERMKDFINWVMSSEGQKVVESSGYIPLWK